MASVPLTNSSRASTSTEAASAHFTAPRSAETENSQKSFTDSAKEGKSSVVLVYHCWICTAEFLDKLGILRHLQEWHKDRPELDGIENKMKVPICLVCGSSDSCEHREENDKMKNGEDDADCAYDESMEDTSLSIPRFQHCATCEKTFSSSESLHDHRASDHPDEKMFQCSFCTSTFSERRHMIAHMRIHSGCRPYICVVCGSRFPRSNDLKRHSQIHTGVRPFKCAQCSKTFTQKCSLEKHAKVHAKQSGGHACLLCGLVFTHAQKLTEHTETEHGEVQYRCQICGKMYKEEKFLILHEKSHSSDKMFPCSFCSRRFSSQSLASKHEEKAHKSKTDSECPECGKIFKRKENLTRHMLSHTGQKNIVCSECGLAFTEKGSLTRHIKSQHEQLRPHSCPVCGRAFTRRFLVRKHMERTHSNKPKDDSPSAFFKCKVCKKVLRVSGVRHHIKHHKQKGDSWEGDIEEDVPDSEKMEGRNEKDRETKERKNDSEWSESQRNDNSLPSNPSETMGRLPSFGSFSQPQFAYDPPSYSYFPNM